MDSKIEISEDRAADLDEKIQFLIENASEHLEIEVEYFVPDKLKEGGAYKTVKGCFKRVDDETHNVILMDGTVILIFYHINIIFAIKIIILSFPKIQPRHIGIRKKRQLTIANRQRKEPYNAGFNRLQDLENTVRNSIIDKIGYAE